MVASQNYVSRLSTATGREGFRNERREGEEREEEEDEKDEKVEGEGENLLLGRAGDGRI